MQTELLAAIAEWLEAGAPHKGDVAGFDMNLIQQNKDCGAVCCIAGAANQFFGDKSKNDNTDINAEFTDGTNPIIAAGDAAAKVLGLTHVQADHLFFPDSHCNVFDFDDLDAVTPAWAARCIRNLIATGVVDWEATQP